MLVLIFNSLFSQLPLQSNEIFNTGAFDCTREKIVRTESWTNTGFTFVRKGQLWMGMYTESVADLGFAVQRERDRTWLFRGNWDHYAEPTGIQDQIVDMDFSPDYILLLPGEKVNLYYHCLDLAEKDGVGHIIVNLWSFP